MAMPMRFVNVRSRLVNIACSRRYLLFCDNRALVKNFSHKANENTTNNQNEDEEDFFGIPENFKLQHARHSSTTNNQNSSNANISRETSPQNINQTTSSNDVSSVSQEHDDQNKYSSVVSELKSIILRRKERRRVHATFGTTFGTISLDENRRDKNLTTEDLALKAQEILTKLDTGKHTVSSSNNNMEIRHKSTDGAVVKQLSNTDSNKNQDMTSMQMSPEDRYLSKSTSVPMSPDRYLFKSTSMQMSPDTYLSVSNYIDEIYFPQHLVNEDAGILGQQTHTNKSDLQSSVNEHHSSSQQNRSEQLSSLSPGVNPTAEESKTGCGSGGCPEHNAGLSVSLLDEQYFGAVLKEGSEMSKHECSQKDASMSIKNENDILPKESSQCDNFLIKDQQMLRNKGVEFNEIDSQYFGDTFQNISSSKHKNDGVQTALSDKKNVSISEIEEDYSSDSNLNKEKTESSPVYVRNQTRHEKRKQNKQHATNQPQIDNTQINIKSKLSSLAGVIPDNKVSLFADKGTHEFPGKQDKNEDSPILSTDDFLQKHNRINKTTKPDTDTPVTAYDLAMKIRQDLKQGKKLDLKALDDPKNISGATDENKQTDSGIKLDSKGFRLLDNQVPDLDRMTSADIVRFLKSRIIFDHEDFLAIDKPYGFPCYSQKQERVSLTELLPAFAEHLKRGYKTSELHLVQGLDRDVTGAVILAKNPEVAHILHGMYKDSELVTQKFWAITKGVPNPPAGIIDIPVGEGKVGDIYKMVLRPRFLKDEKEIGQASKAHSERAITQYSILSSHLQSALVECLLLTHGVKHQIRLHLASGLGTPILGDHKYSNFGKLAPQKLHPEMLKLLKIRQATVRKLALHLHCRSVILKDYKGRMIFLTTYPPSHFRDNMRSLKIPKREIYH